ncbi:UDP-N-acetylmuramoyl-L-alanine--D-glutamate ligase [Thalassotalea psychrophila]|uniref:UDP-N-acetylmuramoylalanine--D-glutamate ligase n=1 Tax=Thalassotalea psychrophila TaxID=3065647 RepID=A0ABY9TW04_9GAMM|nr:UDP-N-acetylmuramoyl-L-alanine--D-glutamate ligase [Colwelliaceae bacterium SQ149]
MTTLALLQDKNILVLGLGATGLSCARFLTSQNVDFVVNDSRQKPPGVARLKQLNNKIQLISGCWDVDAIANADLIIASPGVDINLPEIVNNRKAGSELIGDVELFCQLSNCKVIAVTGSNGKSTVVSILAHLAEYCELDAALAGNIGLPVLDVVNEAKDFVILELSSFQLETMTSMQAVAATILNISDDHLDRHQTIENYAQIKHKIFSQSKRRVITREQDLSQPITQFTTDVSFGLDNPDEGHFGIADVAGIRYLCFGDTSLVACNQLPIVGKHNELNCLAALALGYCAGWPIDKMVKGLASFEGLDHRCKQVDSGDDIVWVNDSKATNIGATLAAIDGLASSHHKLILIAGGDGKGANFNELKPALAHVDHLVTLGKDGPQIAALKADSIQVATLQEAVTASRKLANTGDMVLLSPACASIDMFNNYMQRGDMFIEAIREAS